MLLSAAAVTDADTSRNAVVSGKYPQELQAILRELAYRFSQVLRYRFPVGTSSGRRRMAGNCVTVPFGHSKTFGACFEGVPPCVVWPKLRVGDTQ